MTLGRLVELGFAITSNRAAFAAPVNWRRTAVHQDKNPMRAADVNSIAALVAAQPPVRTGPACMIS
jgi:hypothetical protein